MMEKVKNAIYDVFVQYDLSEQEVIKIIQEAAAEYILSLKKRLKGVEQKTTDNK